MDTLLIITKLFQNIGVVTYLIVAVASLLFIKSKFSQRNNLKLAPRATGGHFLFGHVMEMFNKPNILFERLRKKHGSIFSIGFGGKYAVVLANWESVKEFLKMDGMSDRASALITISDDFDTLLEINGKPWEDRRKFMNHVLRELSHSKSTEPLITYEVSQVLKNMEKMDLAEDVNFHKLIATASNNVGISTVCGKSDEAGIGMSDFISDFNMAALNIFKYRPIAKIIGFPASIFSLVSPAFRKSVKTLNKMVDFIRSEITAHAETLDDQNPRDLIDYALIEMGKSNETQKIRKTSEVIGDVLTVLGAGTDTITVTSEWAFLLLAEHRDMQDKIYKEIVQVYGNRKPTWDQHTSLPFTEAFITESQRWKTILPMLFPRKIERDIKIQGYDVPKGSYILSSLHCVHMDEQVYTNPKKFDPTRFLSGDGTRVVIPEYCVPFSYGNRNCVGEKTAKMELFLILTGMLQKYQILPPKGGVNLEEMFVTALMPVHPYVRMEKRL